MIMVNSVEIHNQSANICLGFVVVYEILINALPTFWCFMILDSFCGKKSRLGDCQSAKYTIYNFSIKSKEFLNMLIKA